MALMAGEPLPDGHKAVMCMADFLSKMPSWSVTLSATYDTLQPGGRKVEWKEVSSVILRRPNRLRIKRERSDGSRSLVVYDGKEITAFDPSAQVYAQAWRIGTVDDGAFFFVRDLGMPLPLAVLLLKRLPAELQERGQSVGYVEKAAVLGVPANHIVGKTATVDFQLWIADGYRPLPLLAELTYKDAPGQPHFRAQFSDWKLDSKPPDSLFTFRPPTGANKIPFAATLSIAYSRRGARGGGFSLGGPLESGSAALGPGSSIVANDGIVPSSPQQFAAITQTNRLQYDASQPCAAPIVASGPGGLQYFQCAFTWYRQAYGPNGPTFVAVRSAVF